MSSVPAPLHLLLLGKALADDGIHTVASTKAEEIRSPER
jgi:hypothetical protein